jgi:glutaredoxin
MLRFYQVEWCSYCHTVRQVMTELRLPFTAINVAADPDERAEVVAVSGQPGVPMLQDGDKVFTDSAEIVEYLRATYPAPDDADEQAARGAWRAAVAVSLAPRAALARLKEVLEEKGFTIVTQVKGPKISERLPKEYVLLHVSAPVAAVKTIEIDALAPGAVLLPVAVLPKQDGTSVVAGADPVAQVWLFGEPELKKVQGAVKQRLFEVLDAL